MAKDSGNTNAMLNFKENIADIGQKLRQGVVDYGLPIAGFGFLGSHLYNIYSGLNTAGDNPWLKEYNAIAYSVSSITYLLNNWLETKNIDGQRLGNTINLVGGTCVLAGACQEQFAFMGAASLVALVTNFRSSYLTPTKTPTTQANTALMADPFVQASTISAVLNTIFASETAYHMFVENSPTAPAVQLTWPVMAGVLLARNIFVAQDKMVGSAGIEPATRPL